MPTLSEVLPALIPEAGVATALCGALEGVESDVSDDVLAREDVQRAIDQAAAILVDNRSLPFGRMLPGLAMVGGEPIDQDVLPVRVYNALARNDVRTWGGLARMCPADLLAMRTLGIVYLRAVAAIALRRVLALALELTWSGLPSAQEEENASSSYGPAVAGYRAVPIHALAQWAVLERDATFLGDLLRLAPDLGPIPADLRAAWEQASRRRLAELFGPRPLPRLAELVTRVLSTFDNRDRLILDERVLADKPTTVGDLAVRLGVSSTRVGQLHARVVAGLRSSTQSAPFAPLRWRAEGLAHRLGPRLPVDSPALADALGWATRDVPQELADVGGRLMLWLAGPYLRCGGELVRASADPRTVEARIATPAELVRWNTGMLDSAPAVLAAPGVPMAIAELEAHIAESTLWV
ncbi:MAG: hypothetical protein ACRD0K_03000 [Egibacteraceae bacterium]